MYIAWLWGLPGSGLASVQAASGQGSVEGAKSLKKNTYVLEHFLSANIVCSYVCLVCLKPLVTKSYKTLFFYDF